MPSDLQKINHIPMKNICLTVIALFSACSLFAQVKTTGTTHDNKTTKLATVNSAIRPNVAEVLQSIEAKMIKIEGGRFQMGCLNEKDSDCYYWEKPARMVTVSSFYMGKFVVTQKEWEALVGTKPWFSKDCPDCPVENVSWFDAQVFINMLNQLTGRYYRLPTEAEWEFAARGGNKSLGYKYAGSSVGSVVAWYDTNSGKTTHTVGEKLPNELGLYDMSGNVWQWCADWFDDKYYSKNINDNPTGPANNQEHDFYRACRGGSWWSEVNNSRVSNRDRYPPDGKDDDVGFRLARD